MGNINYQEMCIPLKRLRKNPDLQSLKNQKQNWHYKAERSSSSPTHDKIQKTPEHEILNRASKTSQNTHNAYICHGFSKICCSTRHSKANLQASTCTYNHRFSTINQASTHQSPGPSQRRPSLAPSQQRK